MPKEYEFKEKDGVISMDEIEQNISSNEKNIIQLVNLKYAFVLSSTQSKILE